MALFIGILWAKPWEHGRPPVAVVPNPTSGPTPTALLTAAPPQSTATPRASPSADPSPTPSPTANAVALGMKRRHCDLADAWRLVSMEESASWRTRTLWGARVQDGSGPDDESIVASREYAQRLTAVGICVPWIPQMRPADLLKHVTLWHVVAGGARAIAQPKIVDVPLYDTGEAYFAPPAELGESWPAGRYVFEIERVAGAGSRFMALDYFPTVARDAPVAER